MNIFDNKKLSEKKNYIGVDIGKTKVSAALVTGSGIIIKKYKVSTNMKEGGHAIVIQCRSLIKKLLDETNAFPQGIGVGSSGIIDHESGVTLSSGLIPNWKNIKLKDFLECEFGVPVSVDNDVNAAALGEYLFGAGKGLNISVFLNIGTGIGFCIIDKGKIWYGSNGLAGQIAYLPLFGSIKTVNDVFSGAGIAENASSIMGYPVTTEEAFDLAGKGNIKITQIITEAIRGAAITIAWIQNTVDPDIIILGGGVAVNQENFIKNVCLEAQRYVYNYKMRLETKMKIVPALLGTEVGTIGAACLCMNDWQHL